MCPVLDDISRLSTCNICILAPSMRVCAVCQFVQAWTELLALVLLVPPEPISLNTMTLEGQAEWFKDLPERPF